MNGNSSKQVLLSVLGIAVLVVAVVGVSFAFFSYSKQGSGENMLTTGNIFLKFTDGDTLVLTNQFPVTDAVGSAYTAQQAGQSGPVLRFTVEGYNTSSRPINYSVTATTGDVYYNDAPTNSDARTPLHDHEIKLELAVEEKVGTGSYGSVSVGSVTNNFPSTSRANNFVDKNHESLSGGVVLATGTIPAGTAVASKLTHQYTVRMWISQDSCFINENETSGNDDNTYNSAEFANLYYSMKIRVDGTAVNPS